jgi:hypothetical protein
MGRGPRFFQANPERARPDKRMIGGEPGSLVSA